MEEMYKKIFSENLNYYMKLNNKTQMDLVNDLHFDKSTVSTWCNGTRLPRMDKVGILAKYFGINRSDLIESRTENAYYINDETHEIAPKIFENPDLSSIFDVTLDKLFASRITYFLEKTGKTQQQLADYMNVSQAAVSAWCLGQKMPRMNKIDQICQFFNCKRSDLMQEPESNTYYNNDDARELAEFLFANPEYKVLFDASKKVKKEDIELVKTILDKFRG